MKSFLIFLSCILFFMACDTNKANKQNASNKKNEVIVLGTIHSGHLKAATYNLEVLSNLIQSIKPDLILAEIPPDRFPKAMQEFQETDTITEARVKRFPEYVDVIFPLMKSMDFEIIPTAGWTKEMADARRQKLEAISKDSTRAAEWNQLTTAAQQSDSLIKATGKEFDPYWINSAAYDRLVEIELSVYNKLFNEELGLGGWDNINEAHYAHIAKALDQHKNQGKRVLITYGAGHKGWFLKALENNSSVNFH